MKFSHHSNYLTVNIQNKQKNVRLITSPTLGAQEFEIIVTFIQGIKFT